MNVASMADLSLKSIVTTEAMAAKRGDAVASPRMNHLCTLGVMLGCSVISCTSSSAPPPAPSAAAPTDPGVPIRPTLPAKGALASSGWSSPVNGLQGRLLVSAGEGTSPRIVRIDLELQNVSNVGSPMELYWDIDAVLSFSLADEEGKEIETTPTAASIRRAAPYWLMLPMDSTLRTNLTTHGYGIEPKPGVFIGLPNMMAWQIDATDKRRRRIHGVLTATATTAADGREWKGTLDLPLVEIP
jgi:hypothetical protein